MIRFSASAAPQRALHSRTAPFKYAGCEILYRGFIANPAFILAEARRRGELPTGTDTAEMFALAYRWWGQDLPRHVLGEYALAVYDGNAGSVLLTHDELGLIPLFYSVRRDELIFATYLEDLLQETGIETLDEDYLADYLTRGMYIGARTPFAHIRRVAAGESVIWNDGQLRKHACWTLSEVQPLHYRDAREYEERCAELIEEAVASALPAQGKVWCELSGGLDSSTVLSVAARAAPTRVEAVSFVYSRSYLADEQPWMRAVLDQHSVPWHRIDIDAVPPFSAIPSRFVAEPGDRLFKQTASHLYEDHVRRHGVAVVLTGQGGDAVLLGDQPGPYFLADLLRMGQFLRLSRELRELLEHSRAKRSMTYWGLHYALLPLLRHRRAQLVDGYFHRTPLPSWLADDFAASMNLSRRARASYLPRIRSIDNTAMLERVLAVTECLTKHGHYNNNSHIQFRHPLLYRPLLEFMLAAPSAHRYHAAGDRILQRRAMVGIVPEQTLQRRDKGSPSQAFYEGLEASPEWQDLLTLRPHIVARGYADLPRWRDTVQQACLGRTVGFGAFAASVNLEAWLGQLRLFTPLGEPGVPAQIRR